MGNYIMDLRKTVGHRPLVMCAASALILNNKDELLLQLRADNNMWGLTGGALELGETLEDTVRREAKEETGLELGRLEFFNIYSGENLHYIYPNGDEVYIVSTVYLTKDYSGTLKLDEEEVKELRFFNKENIPDNIFPPDQETIKDFLKYKSNNIVER